MIIDKNNKTECGFVINLGKSNSTKYIIKHLTKCHEAEKLLLESIDETI